MRDRLLSGFCGILLLAGAAYAEPDTLPADVAHKMVQRGELTLLDVRTPSEWAMTGVPRDSRPANVNDPDFIAQARGAVYGDLEHPVAVIGIADARSIGAAEKLQAGGFKRVYYISEGIGDGWLKRGLPTDPFIPPM